MKHTRHFADLFRQFLKNDDPWPENPTSGNARWIASPAAADVIESRFYELGATMAPEDLAQVRLIMTTKKLSPRKSVAQYLEEKRNEHV